MEYLQLPLAQCANLHLFTVTLCTFCKKQLQTAQSFDYCYSFKVLIADAKIIAELHFFSS